MAGVLQNMTIPRAGFIPVAPGRQPIGRPGGDWSFEINEGHKLQHIKIDHDDNMIYALMFTTEFNGALSISNNFGLESGHTLSKITLDSDEEIVGIKVSIGLKGRDTVLHALSFETNKTTHGPFGGTTNPMFSLPWDKGSLVGFYGVASDWVGGIGGIGVYLKAHREIMRIGTWGRAFPASSQTIWSFQLEGNQRLNKITIYLSGDVINFLMFNSSEDVADRSGVSIVDHVTLDEDEEIIGINGHVATLLTRQIIISSLFFTTNKKTHGPFGNALGEPFGVSWAAGSFAGFYGLQGRSLESIGVYLKAAN